MWQAISQNVKVYFAFHLCIVSFPFVIPAVHRVLDAVQAVFARG